MKDAPAEWQIKIQSQWALIGKAKILVAEIWWPLTLCHSQIISCFGRLVWAAKLKFQILLIKISNMLWASPSHFQSIATGFSIVAPLNRFVEPFKYQLWNQLLSTTRSWQNPTGFEHFSCFCLQLHEISSEWTQISSWAKIWCCWTISIWYDPDLKFQIWSKSVKSSLGSTSWCLDFCLHRPSSINLCTIWAGWRLFLWAPRTS